MFDTIRKRMFSAEDRATWSTDRWRTHLLAHASTSRERDEIIAIFSRG